LALEDKWSREELDTALDLARLASELIPSIVKFSEVDGLKRTYRKKTVPFLGSVTSVALGLGRDRDAEWQAYVALFHDVFDNPHRRMVIDPAWLAHGDRLVPRLARTIYDDRAFDVLPRLADALEAAGCADAEILNHCRRPAEHCRGCKVIDAILGLE
jgi:hypothetical protein